MKIRDAGTGRYISATEAQERTPETWIVEADSDDNTELLQNLYDDFNAKATWEQDEFKSVRFVDVIEVLEKYGLKK